MNQPPTPLPATPSPQPTDPIPDGSGAIHGTYRCRADEHGFVILNGQVVVHTDRTIAAPQTNAQRGQMWMEAHGDA